VIGRPPRYLSCVNIIRRDRDQVSLSPFIHSSWEDVMTLRTACRMSLWLGVVSVLAIVTAHLALTDIYHREADVSPEWNVVRVSFLIIFTFHVFALTAAWKGRGQLPF
jgi:hypothetical protein